MADKLTQQVLDALARAAAEPTGLPLYAGKADAGLFPNVAAAKPAAQKCLADDLVRVAGTDAKGKAARDLYALTEKGWEFLLAAVNPKQVLEDFVRVLEARQGEVTDLLRTARRMADSLQGLKDAVSRVLPTVTAARVAEGQPLPPTPSPKKGGGDSWDSVLEPSERGRAREVVGATTHTASAGGGGDAAAAVLSPSLLRGGVGEGLLPEVELAPAVLAYLADHPGPADCTLPELFRALALTDAFTIGAFHDCLRELHADGRVVLSQWTGPLYALPEPQFALLIGHGIAYYASLRG